MDVFSEYNQIQINSNDQEKTYIIIKDDLFYYKIISFGLKKTRATYQKLVNNVFKKQIKRHM